MRLPVPAAPSLSLSPAAGGKAPFRPAGPSPWRAGRLRAGAGMTLVAALLFLAPAPGPAAAPPATVVPHVVTADIQAGLEAHIAEQTRRGNGFFHLPLGDRALRLKLVRVHTDFLSTLGPRRHFACVDMVDVLGDVFDVDFYLEGDPGAMTVTDTSVHKVNGQPFYAWRQNPDRTWKRVPIDQAPPAS